MAKVIQHQAPQSEPYSKEHIVIDGRRVVIPTSEPWYVKILALLPRNLRWIVGLISIALFWEMILG